MTRAARRIRWRVVAPWLALVMLSATLHLWKLGDRSFHHDEAIHAKLSWDLAERGAYRYDPTYHGPLLYYLTSATYLILGDSDFTARLPIAIAGIAMLWMAFSLRRRIGGRAAWWTGLLVTISPLFLFFGRFLRMDILEALMASGAIIAWLGVVRDRPRAWIWLGVWTGLAFATKENAYVTALLLGATALALGMDHGLRRAVPMTFNWFADRWSGLALSLAVFVLVTVPLYTVGFRYPGDWAFPFRAIDYWWGQHTVQRVAGPWWFHLPRLVQYEGAILALATVWICRRWRRARSLELGLYVFGVLSILMYMYLGEKVPWLGVHQVWPFLPLAGAQLARSFGPRGRWWSRSLAGLALAYTVVVSLIANFVLQEITPARDRVESLHFVQTCPEATAVAMEGLAIDQERDPLVAAVSGDGAWPLSWYWRDLPVAWSKPSDGQRPPLVIVNPEREADVVNLLGPGYRRERVPLRAWWLMYAGDPGPWDVLRYFATRVPWSAIGSTDVIVLRRTDEARPTVRELDVPATVAAALSIDSAEILGEGWFREVRGIAISGDRLAIADPVGSTVRVLDLEGRLADDAASKGLDQPESIAWTAGGALLIADTWNHRVLVRDEARERELPAPADGWYGPRSIAVASDGWLAVSDTGHQRLVLYEDVDSPPATILSSGSWGDLLEPGGVAWLPEGGLIVCDTGHHRILQLSRSGSLEDEIALPDAWSDYYSRPQIVAIDGDLWIASDTPGRALWKIRSGAVTRIPFDADGASPTGVAWDHDSQTLVVGDLAGRVWLLEVAGG